MTDATEPVDLAALEQRVTEKLVAALPKWDLPTDAAEWLGAPIDPPAVDVPPVPADWPQFPRERWITYPPRRAWALCLADRLIDLGKLAEAGFLVQFGGKERIS